MTKFELPISTSYVPNWGVVEAVREIFQNAVDNEIENTENKMSWEYKDNNLTISNKTSKLSARSLLLGESSKRDNKDTIGQHGEGYKIAFMVLLRNDKKITVYNYGAKEVWEVRLVKSKRYCGELLTTVFVDKQAVWKKIPNDDLSIVIEGITEDEFNDIVSKNLILQKLIIPENFTSDRVFYGSKGNNILLSESERGNIYVKGLFVCNNDKLKYGYDFLPSVISLDRDRKLIDTFYLFWEASVLWQEAAASGKEELESRFLALYHNKDGDVKYIKDMSMHITAVADIVAHDFFDKNGDDAIPVTDSSEYEIVKRNREGTPVIVSEEHKQLLSHSSFIGCTEIVEKITVQDKLRIWIDKIVDKYNIEDDDIDEFNKIVDEI